MTYEYGWSNYHYQNTYLQVRVRSGNKNQFSMTENKVVNYSHFEDQFPSQLIFGNFTERKRNYDLYDSSILKGITLFIYISEIISSVIMFAFVRYVRNGNAGSYRTFNNQLLAYLHGGV